MRNLNEGYKIAVIDKLLVESQPRGYKDMGVKTRICDSAIAISFCIGTWVHLIFGVHYKGRQLLTSGLLPCKTGVSLKEGICSLYEQILFLKKFHCKWEALLFRQGLFPLNVCLPTGIKLMYVFKALDIDFMGSRENPKLQLLHKTIGAFNIFRAFILSPHRKPVLWFNIIFHLNPFVGWNCVYDIFS